MQALISSFIVTFKNTVQSLRDRSHEDVFCCLRCFFCCYCAPGSDSHTPKSAVRVCSFRSCIYVNVDGDRRSLRAGIFNRCRNKTRGQQKKVHFLELSVRNRSGRQRSFKTKVLYLKVSPQLLPRRCKISKYFSARKEKRVSELSDHSNLLRSTWNRMVATFGNDNFQSFEYTRSTSAVACSCQLTAGMKFENFLRLSFLMSRKSRS